MQEDKTIDSQIQEDKTIDSQIQEDKTIDSQIQEDKTIDSQMQEDKTVDSQIQEQKDKTVDSPAYACQNISLVEKKTPLHFLARGCRLDLSSESGDFIFARDGETPAVSLPLLSEDYLLLDFETETPSAGTAVGVHFVAFSAASGTFSYWRWSVERSGGRAEKTHHLDVGRRDKIGLLKDMKGKVWMTTLKSDDEYQDPAMDENLRLLQNPQNPPVLFLMDPEKSFSQKEKIILPARGERVKLRLEKREREVIHLLSFYQKDGSPVKYRCWRGEWEKTE